jgi:hypothetical protein
LRVFNGVASALLVIFNAAIAVWPMVALKVTLTAINVFYIVRLLRGRHDSRTFEVVEISPNEAYLKHLLHEFDADIQHFNPAFSGDDAAHTDLGLLILTGAEPVGLVLARNAGDRSAQVDLDYVVPRYQGFTLGEFVYPPAVRLPRGATDERSHHPECRIQEIPDRRWFPARRRRHGPRPRLSCRT